MSVQGDTERMVEVFACVDGGVALVKFRFAMLDIESRNDPASRELVEIFNRFRRLVDVMTGV